MCLDGSTDHTSNKQLLDVIDSRSLLIDDIEKSVNVVRTSGCLIA